MLDYGFWYDVAVYANTAWKGSFTPKEVATNAYNYCTSWSYTGGEEAIPLEEIDKLHDIINKIGKNANNKGNLYYAVLDFINKYGTHSTGDYFKNINKFKAEREVSDTIADLMVMLAEDGSEEANEFLEEIRKEVVREVC